MAYGPHNYQSTLLGVMEIDYTTLCFVNYVLFSIQKRIIHINAQ